MERLKKLKMVHAHALGWYMILRLNGYGADIQLKRVKRLQQEIMAYGEFQKKNKYVCK